MKTLGKVISMVLVCLIVFILTGCGGGDSGSSRETDPLGVEAIIAKDVLGITTITVIVTLDAVPVEDADVTVNETNIPLNIFLPGTGTYSSIIVPIINAGEEVTLSVVKDTYTAGITLYMPL